MARTPLARILILIAAITAVNADLQPNLTFQYTVPVFNPVIRNGGWGFDTYDMPPSVFAGQDPNSMYATGTDGNTTIGLWLQFYGKGLTVGGNARKARVQMVVGNQTVPSSPPVDALSDLYVADNLTWGFHNVGLYVQGSNPLPELHKFTFTTGMRTQAPSFDEVERTVVPFAKLDQPTDSPYILFPWGNYPFRVLKDTPVNSTVGQLARPCSGVRVRLVDDNHHLVITPPANTSYVMLNATMTNDSYQFYIYSDPPLPGRAKDQMTVMSLYSDYYPFSNVRAFETPLDPAIQYNISIVPSSQFAPNPVWNSVTFFSYWYKGSSNNHNNDSNNDSNNTTTSGTPEAGAAVENKSSAGAIAGGVVGGLVGGALIAIVVFFLVRRKKSRTSKVDPADFDIDESNLHRGPIPVMTPYRPTNGGSTDISENSSAWAPLGPPGGAVKGYDVVKSPPAEYSKFRETARLPFTSSDTQSSTVSSPSTTTSAPSLPPMMQPTVRQEEDLGYIEPEPQMEEIVPPLYNPQWEEDARRRGRRHGLSPQAPQ